MVASGSVSKIKDIARATSILGAVGLSSAIRESTVIPRSSLALEIGAVVHLHHGPNGVVSVRGIHL